MIGVLKKLRDGDSASGETVELFGQTTVVSYWDNFRNFQPGTTVAELRIPALILVGGHDAEVTHDDFDQLKRALAKRADDTVKLYPDVFHLFMPSNLNKKRPRFTGRLDPTCSRHGCARHGIMDSVTFQKLMWVRPSETLQSGLCHQSWRSVLESVEYSPNFAPHADL
jgi:hypothetical protein